MGIDKDWETLGCHEHRDTAGRDKRIKVDGGWVVMASGRSRTPFVGLTFVADPDHQWDGFSLDKLPK